jgi:hypothetical protein
MPKFAFRLVHAFGRVELPKLVKNWNARLCTPPRDSLWGGLSRRKGVQQPDLNHALLPHTAHVSKALVYCPVQPD